MFILWEEKFDTGKERREKGYLSGFFGERIILQLYHDMVKRGERRFERVPGTGIFCIESGWPSIKQAC